MDEFLCGFSQEQANKAIETARESLRVSLETRSAFNDYKNDCVSEIDYATLEIAKLSQLVELVFNLLGVNIYDENGQVRDMDEVYSEIKSLNPKITLSFQDLMQL